MKRTFAAALLSLSVAACGGSASPQPREEPPELPSDDNCVRDILEPDIQLTPLQGPGIDAEGRLAPGTYMMSSTYLRLGHTQEAHAEFQQLTHAIEETLQQQPGLVALQFGLSASCDTARTLTVWRDEEAMYEFVSSSAHVQAMSRVSVVSRGGSLATSWQDDERGAGWEKALEQLASDTGSTY